VREVFGDTKRRALTLFARVVSAALAVAIALHVFGLVSLMSARRVMSVAIPVMLVLTLRAIWPQRRTPTARIFLGGLVTMFVIALPDIISISGVQLSNLDFAPFAVLAFCIAMVVLIERRYRDKSEDLVTQSAELTRRVEELLVQRREIEGLNEELRLRVEARSRELREAFGKSGEGQLTATPALAPGDIVAGRYRVEKGLGAGAMGTVHEVLRQSDGRHFALKVMSGQITLEAAARFAREAETAAALVHENLVTIVDVGIHASVMPYIVMELVVGRSLDRAYSRFGEASWALPILADVAAGLLALHERGIIHRDLKPANILLEPHGDIERAKIGDFGVARATHDPLEAAALAQTAPLDPLADTDAAMIAATERMKLTRTGLQMGTPMYMAPECASGGTNLTFEADVFSFGLIAYEVLHDKPAFDPPAVVQAMARLTPPQPAWALHPELPPNTLELLARCLDRDPEKRPTARELCDGLGTESALAMIE